MGTLNFDIEIDMTRDFGDPRGGFSIPGGELNKETDQEKLLKLSFENFRTGYPISSTQNIIVNHINLKKQNLNCLAAAFLILDELKIEDYSVINEDIIDEDLITSYSERIYNFMVEKYNIKKHSKEKTVKRLKFTICSLFFVIKKTVIDILLEKEKYEKFLEDDFDDFLDNERIMEENYIIDEAYQSSNIKDVVELSVKYGLYEGRYKSVRIGNKNAVIFNIYDKDKPIKIYQFLKLLDNHDFVNSFCEIVSSINLSDFSIEFCPISNSLGNQLLEFVLIEDKNLNPEYADETIYKDKFINTKSSVIQYKNKTGSSYIVIPNKSKTVKKQVYINFSNFVKNAENTQKNYFFKLTSKIINNLLNLKVNEEIIVYLNSHYKKNWISLRIDTDSRNYLYEKYK